MATNETRILPGSEIVVRKYGIIGTSIRIFEAWEPSAPEAGHSTITYSLDGAPTDGRYGQVRSRRLPAEIDALPARSNERSSAYRLWRMLLNAEAISAILTAFPEADAGRCADGSIEIVEPA